MLGFFPLSLSAVQAVIEMGKLAEKSSEREDKARVDKNIGSNLLSLAAQIALEVEQIMLSLLSFIDISRTALTSLTWPRFFSVFYGFLGISYFHNKGLTEMCCAMQREINFV